VPSARAVLERLGAVEGTTAFHCQYRTGSTYDLAGHLQLQPGTLGSAQFTDEGFVVTFDEGGRLRVPWESVKYVEVRGDDEKRRDGDVWEAGLLVAALSAPSAHAYLVVGRADGDELVFTIKGHSRSEVHAALAGIGAKLKPQV